MKRLGVFLAGVCLATVAHASVITYAGFMNGANENAPVSTPGTGFVSVTVDTVANTIVFNVSFSGLTSNDVAAHIHCCVAQGGNTGVATELPFLTGFPSGVTSGTFTNQLFSLLDPTFYNPAFITNNGGTTASAEAVLLAGFANSQTYFNIHTMNNAGGEIRGFLIATPEPATFLLAGLALGGLALKRRRSSRGNSSALLG